MNTEVSLVMKFFLFQCFNEWETVLAMLRSIKTPVSGDGSILGDSQDTGTTTPYNGLLTKVDMGSDEKAAPPRTIREADDSGVLQKSDSPDLFT